MFGEARPHHAYLFANRRANRLKVLVHDGYGIWLANRRLNQGRFCWRHGNTSVELSRSQFDALVLGLPWERLADGGVIRIVCPSPDGCPLAKGGNCKPYGRLNVSIGDDDPLGSFVFRTTGFNSIRTLAARLQYFQAISGNRLSCLPLELRLRGKSTRQSHGTPIYYVDLTVRSGVTLEDALLEAKRIDGARQAAGFDQVALEVAARQGLNNGAFEDSEDESGDVIEEFFPVAIKEERDSHKSTIVTNTSKCDVGNSLIEKLEGKQSKGKLSEIVPSQPA